MKTVLTKMSTLCLTMFKLIKQQSVRVVLVNKRFQCNQLQKTIDRDIPLMKLEHDVQIDWDKEMIKIKGPPKSVLADTKEDFSHITPNVSPTFNFAPFVNKSEALQSLVKLGVDLHRIEKKPFLVEKVMQLDFEKDMKKHLIFLNHYVEMDEMGSFLTKNPLIFYESIDDLQTRINYLQSKRFTDDMIKRVVSGNPHWLMFSTMRIDRRLGHFQKEFDLAGNEVRLIVTKQPKLITYNMHHITVATFTIREEMGFSETETKILLMLKPRIWMIDHTALIKRFTYAHNVMKISQKSICEMPNILLCREFKLKQRHTFLEKIGRAQYDNTKPNYITLNKLIEGSDADFCANVAKCSVTQYNLFLKSLC